MMKKYGFFGSFLLICVLTLGGFLSQSFAAEPTVEAPINNPVDQLKTMVGSLQESVSSHTKEIAANQDKLYEIVDQDMIPHMAVSHMAGMVLGPKWSGASPVQRKEFIDQFSLMLARSYAAALMKITHYTIHIEPLRNDDWKTEKKLVVSGSILSSEGGEATQVSYYLLRQKNTWFVYDFAVQGVSIMKNFQTQLQGFSTMDAVLVRIKEVNAQAV